MSCSPFIISALDFNLTRLPYHPRQQQLESLVERLGLSAQCPSINWQLLDRALVHSTASTTQNYEHLEFFGDAVLRLAVAEFLRENFPDAPVGELAALRSVLVSDRSLADIATSYGLDRYLILGSSALNDKTGQQSRLAEAMEAMLAALYLSTNTFALIHPWLDIHFKQIAAAVQADPARQNYKAALQQWTQAHYKALPDYRVTEIGQQHNDPNRFQAEVWLQGKLVGEGQGRSRKAAEQSAAQVAYTALQEEHKSF